MALTDAEVFKLSQGHDETTVGMILTIDALADRVKELSARIEKLEAAEPAKLRLVHDGQGH